MSIKSWWKSLFREPDLANFGLPKVTCDVPMPEVKPCKPEKDISEPVLSFIEVYKENHRRFKINVECVSENVNAWSLHDKKENKTFKAIICYLTYGSYYKGGKNTEWITQDELTFVVDEIRSFLSSRKDRIESKRDVRSRKRLTKLYKGEELC